MEPMVISEDLVELGLKAAGWQEALTCLAERLLAGGYVRPGFTASLLRREAAYPTGLPTVIPVALSHTDPEEVVQSALAVGVLSEPVAFQEMGAPERAVWVEVVFVLALKEAESQVELLKRLTGLLRDRARLEQIRDAADEAAIVMVLGSLI